MAEDVPKPDPDVFLKQLQTLCPNACLVKSVFKTTAALIAQPALTVITPMQKLASFVSSHTCITDTCSCATIFLYYHLPYTPEQCSEIEEITRGQCKNNNWHVLRKGILTSSTFHQICCSTDITKTAQSLIKPGLDESRLPLAISFGRMYESKARNMFLKAHRFKHRHCSVDVPGLILSEDGLFPGLACSPDGIVTCKICGQFLIEIKCSFKYKCFHPNNALKLSGICIEKDGDIFLKKSHKYYYQILGQMAMTGITKAFLVLYTHKGIATVSVDFDKDVWDSVRNKLISFYRDSYFQVLKATIV